MSKGIECLLAKDLTSLICPSKVGTKFIFISKTMGKNKTLKYWATSILNIKVGVRMKLPPKRKGYMISIEENTGKK